MSDTQGKAPSKFWLYGPIVLFVLLIAAYCIYWAVVRDKLEAGVDQWIAEQRATGAQIEYADKRLGGFPYRFALEVDAPHYVDATGATDWRGEQLQVVMQPWNFNHAIIRSAGRNEIAQGNGTNLTALLGQKSAASFKWDAEGLTDFGLNLDTADFVTAQGDIGVRDLTANLVQLPDAENGSRLSVDWEKINLDPSLIQGTDLAFLGTEIQASRLRLEGQGFGVFGEAPTRDAEIAQFLLNWGPVKFGAKGKFDINDEGYPDGTLHVRLEDSAALLKILKEQTNLDSERLGLVGTIGLATKNAGFFTVPIRNGMITYPGLAVSAFPQVAPARPGAS